MQVINKQYHVDMPFDDYLKLPGFSYSGIKNYGQPPIQATNKMRIGTLVHNYLFEPKNYNYEKFEIVKPIAHQVEIILGNALNGMKSEIGVTADFVHEDMKLEYKGRIDLLRAGKIVIDLKVSEKPLYKTIPFFGYDKQLSGYALATESRVAMIIRVCPVTRKTELKTIPISSEWWEKQIVKFGKPV